MGAKKMKKKNTAGTLRWARTRAVGARNHVDDDASNARSRACGVMAKVKNVSLSAFVCPFVVFGSAFRMPLGHTPLVHPTDIGP